MLRLMLFRHAHAERPDGVPDHDRPLSNRGVGEAQRMGRYIKAHGLVPGLAIVSSARRTQETWEHASRAGGFDTPKIDEPRVYESAAGDLLEVLRQQSAVHGSIMLLGHNPGMERLAAWLIGSGERMALNMLQREFVVSGLAVIDFPVTDWGGIDAQFGKLERFVRPEPGAMG